MRLKEKSKEEKKRGKRKEKETEIGSHLKALLAHTKALYSGERERENPNMEGLEFLWPAPIQKRPAIVSRMLILPRL